MEFKSPPYREYLGTLTLTLSPERKEQVDFLSGENQTKLSQRIEFELSLFLQELTPGIEKVIEEMLLDDGVYPDEP